MSNKKSFFIKDKSISENQKVLKRQNLVEKFSRLSSLDLQDLFSVSIPIEQVGIKNCENLVGSVEIPVGVAGPVIADVTYFSPTNISQINKTNKTANKKNVTQKKSFLVPLATTEGALVASIHRGLKMLSIGETNVLVKKVGMSRSVVFECDSATCVSEFIAFFKTKESLFAKYCEETSSHLKYLSHETFTRGKLVFFRFVFDTDEAMGMNMVTIAISYAWEKFKLLVTKKFSVKLLTLSGNVCTDKKDSAINRLYGRGYAVTVESKIKKEDLIKVLKVTPKELVKTHTVKNLIGSNIAGSFSQNMHVANALAAFYVATGQDIAHTVAGSEASVHFEVIDKVGSKFDDGLYVSLTLPNVSVGSVGGGTWLPAQKQARSILHVLDSDSDLDDKHSQKDRPLVTAKDLATVAGLACLAGEISGLAALTSNTLASAHEKLGRSKITESHNSKVK